MKHGQIYKHRKGKLYEFRTIALPLDEFKYSDMYKDNMFTTYDAHSESKDNPETVELYITNSGAILINKENAHVIYRALDDRGKWILWAREVEEFLGVLEDGTKRFTKTNEE